MGGFILLVNLFESYMNYFYQLIYIDLSTYMKLLSISMRRTRDEKYLLEMFKLIRMKTIEDHFNANYLHYFHWAHHNFEYSKQLVYQFPPQFLHEWEHILMHKMLKILNLANMWSMSESHTFIEQFHNHINFRMVYVIFYKIIYDVPWFQEIFKNPKPSREWENSCEIYNSKHD